MQEIVVVLLFIGAVALAVRHFYRIVRTRKGKVCNCPNCEGCCEMRDKTCLREEKEEEKQGRTKKNG